MIRQSIYTSSAISIPISLKIIDISSFHRKSAQEKVRKNIVVPNCLSIAKTWCKNFFQYAGVPLIELIKLKAFSSAVNSFTLYLKFFSKFLQSNCS